MKKKLRLKLQAGWSRHRVVVDEIGTRYHPPLPLTHRLQRWTGNRWRKYDWPKHKDGDLVISRDERGRKEG